MVINTISNKIQDGFHATSVGLNDAVFGQPIRLGVTGLARSGKTVFMTSLISNLLNTGRMPLFKPIANGLLDTSYLTAQPDDTMARFPYEEHIKCLTDIPTKWPENTHNISQLRISMKLKNTGIMGGIRGSYIKNLDIIDYPGEWILDLTLLEKTYVDWCEQMLKRMRMRSFATPSLDALENAEINGTFCETTAQKLTKAYCEYLTTARDNGFSDLTPGRFLLPGDLKGSPVLTFVPLPMCKKPNRDSLWREMERRYNAYLNKVVRPFFRSHFSIIDRQIVLVDILGALEKGPQAIEDLRQTLCDLLLAFKTGKNSIMSRMFRGSRIERLIFAATKADHLHHTQHENLNAILRALVEDAERQAKFSGAKTLTLSIASLRSTTETEHMQNGQSIPCVIGQKSHNKKPVAFFSGTLPNDPSSLISAAKNGHRDWDNASFSTAYFCVPENSIRQGMGLPHIRLDKALDYLISDLL